MTKIFTALETNTEQFYSQLGSYMSHFVFAPHSQQHYNNFISPTQLWNAQRVDFCGNLNHTHRHLQSVWRLQSHYLKLFRSCKYVTVCHLTTRKRRYFVNANVELTSEDYSKWKFARIMLQVLFLAGNIRLLTIGFQFLDVDGVRQLYQLRQNRFTRSLEPALGS